MLLDAGAIVTGVGAIERLMRSPIKSLEVVLEEEVGAGAGPSDKKSIKVASFLGGWVACGEERALPLPTSREGMLGPRILDRGSGCGSAVLDSLRPLVLGGVMLLEDTLAVFTVFFVLLDPAAPVASAPLPWLAVNRFSWYVMNKNLRRYPTSFPSGAGYSLGFHDACHSFAAFYHTFHRMRSDTILNERYKLEMCVRVLFFKL